MLTYMRRTRGGVLALTVISLFPAACDLLLGPERSLDGTWRGSILLDESPVQIELDLTQTFLGAHGPVRRYTVRGKGRYVYSAINMSILCTVEGSYIHPGIGLKLQAYGFVLPTLVGKVSDDGNKITGRLKDSRMDVPVTLRKG